MKQMTLMIFLVLALQLQGQESPSSVPKQSAIEDAIALLRDIDRRFDQLQSIEYHVVKKTGIKGQKYTESFSFSLQAPASVRIDVEKPSRRLVVITEESLIEYIPEARKARKTLFESIKGSERHALISNVLSRATVEGLRIGNTEEMMKRLDRVSVQGESEGLWVLEGSKPDYRIVVDSKRHVLVETELKNENDKVILKTTAVDFNEVVPGFWFPTEIHATYPSDSGWIESTVYLTEVKINTSIPQESFFFHKPRGVEWVLDK
jgi:outer membrane lipoprotein-sorting protein